jgi:hypothetical protein
MRTVHGLPGWLRKTRHTGEADARSCLRNRQLVGLHGERVAAVLSSERSTLHEVAQRLLQEEGVAAGVVEQERRGRLGKLGVGERQRIVRLQRPELELDVAVPVPPAGQLPEAPAGTSGSER